MEQHIGPSFKKIKAYIYHKDKNGFYVYAKPNLCDPNTVIKYITATILMTDVIYKKAFVCITIICIAVDMIFGTDFIKHFFIHSLYKNICAATK